MADSIFYDETQKSWKALDYPYTSFINRSIGQVFMENARKVASGKILEKHFDTGLEKTMADIYRESITVAINLTKIGVKAGDVLVLYSMVNHKTSALTMGSFLLGVTVCFFETKFEKHQAASVLELISPTIIITEEQCSAVLKEAIKHINLPQLKQVLAIDGGFSYGTVDSTLFYPIDPTEIEAFEPPPLGNPQELVAAYMLTSGSTGLPKVVCISHSLMLNGMLTWWSVPQHKADLTPDSVLFSFSPLRWISQVQLMLQSLLLGILRVCANGFPEGPYGREIIRTGGVTHFFSPPTVFRDILLSISSDDSDALISLRSVLLGGESPSQVIIDLSKQLTPNATIYRCYGMTEQAGCIANDTKVNGGYLLPGMELKVMDDSQTWAGPNTNGQLYIRASVPYIGHLKLRNSNYFDQDGFFNTGDYGFVDGNKALNVLARYKSLVRAKDIIMIPNEVESLVNTLPEIFSSIFVGYRQRVTDTQDSGAVFVLLNDGIETAANGIESEIGNTLKASLPPTEYEIIKKIVVLQKFPLTTCGKVDRVSLAQLAASYDKISETKLSF